MGLKEEDLFEQNKVLEEKLDYVIHVIESRIDKSFRSRSCRDEGSQLSGSHRPIRTHAGSKKISSDPYSSQTFFTFRYPYIRDFRNFCTPFNQDLKQIQQLPTGQDNVDTLWKQKLWSKEAKHQLREAVLENYSRNHLLKLIKQKNQLLQSQCTSLEDLTQKVRLIDEQVDQLKARNEPRIFVPENRFDKQIDWCAISAKLSNYHHDAQDCRLMWSNQLHWTINDHEWTKDEDMGLINAVSKYGQNDWDLIAHELNTNRVPWQCCARYHQNFACIESSFHPESEETEKIIEVINLCRIGNFVPWNQVMYFIQFHSLHQVKHQWQRYLDQWQGCTRDSTKVWSDQEDLLLIQAVARYGEKDWARVADSIPGRTNKSCRERYMMRARFTRRAVGSWKPSEDSKLLSLVERMGPSWSSIVEHFPERNNHQIRNRYELLKSQNIVKRGPIRHRKLYRNLTLDSVRFGCSVKRHKLAGEIEVDRRLCEIFTTYKCLNKSVAPKKSLTCRSFQDEQIYQCLVETLCDILMGTIRKKESSNLDLIMLEAVKSCTSISAGCEDDTDQLGFFVMTPSRPTLQAYKAWSLQQDYLSQFKIDPDLKLEDIDERITNIVVSIFLMPALLSKVSAPKVDLLSNQVGSLIDKRSKNLYNVRNLQSNLLKR